MENYTKCESSQSEEDSGTLPFKNLDENVIRLRIRRGSKMRNILGYAIKTFKPDDKRHLICAATGPAVSKAISCAEILKRKFKNLQQITKIRSLKLEEVWEPNQAELDKLKVTREIPSIHILLSKDHLDAEEPGFQPPGKNNGLWLKKVSGKTDEMEEKLQPKAPPRKRKPNKQIKKSKDDVSETTNKS